MSDGSGSKNKKKKKEKKKNKEEFRIAILSDRSVMLGIAKTLNGIHRTVCKRH